MLRNIHRYLGILIKKCTVTEIMQRSEKAAVRHVVTVKNGIRVGEIALVQALHKDAAGDTV